MKGSRVKCILLALFPLLEARDGEGVGGQWDNGRRSPAQVNNGFPAGLQFGPLEVNYTQNCADRQPS